MPGSPFVSEAQRKKWQQLVQQGKRTQQEFDGKQAASPSTLPDRISAPRTPSTSQYTRALKRQIY